MAFARVSANDSDGAAAATPFSVAYTNAPSAGNLLIICVASPNPPGSVSATGWTLIEEAPFQTSTRAAAILAKISAGAGDQTVSVNSTGGGTMHWNAFEFSGAALTIVQDGTATGSQDAGVAVATLASASITLANTSSLIIFVRATSSTDGGSNTWTNGTLLAANLRNRISVAQWVPGTIGAKTTTNSWASAVRAGMAIAAFIPMIAPTVTSSAATLITTSSAQANGNVTSDGGDTITERGAVMSLLANPTTADNKFSTSGTTGAFNVSITGLTPGLAYNYRAYAINSIGTSYGANIAFTASLNKTLINSLRPHPFSPGLAR